MKKRSILIFIKNENRFKKYQRKLSKKQKGATLIGLNLDQGLLSCMRKFQILFKKKLLNKWSYYFLANYKNPTIESLIIDFTQKRMFGLLIVLLVDCRS